METLITLIVALLATEIWAWLPAFSTWIIETAARLLPKKLRQRYTEEWLSHLEDLPGRMSQFGHALGVVLAAYKIGVRSRNPIPSFDADLTVIGIQISFVAKWLEDRGRLQIAEFIYRRAISTFGAIYGRNNPHVLYYLRALGNLMYRAARFGDATLAFRSFHRRAPKSIGAWHSETGANLCDWGESLRISGHPKKAMPILERAIVIQDHGRPVGDTKIAESLNNLALCYRDQATKENDDSKLSIALDLLRKAIVLTEEQEHPRDRNDAAYRENMAEICVRVGNIKEAQKMFFDAARITKSACGFNSLEFGLSWCKLGNFLGNQNCNRKSLSIIQKGIDFAQAAKPDHFKIGFMHNFLAKAYLREHDYLNAQKSYEKALVCLRSSWNDNDIRLASLKNAIEEIKKLAH